MENQIQTPELMEGDILLYHGSNWLSRAIRFFDGSDYNHASLYDGHNFVMEAIAQGVIKRDIDTSINDSVPVIIKRLNKRPQDMTPVLNKASEYEGNRYGYEQLLLLALICSLRKIRLNNFVSRFVRKILESAASILLQFTQGDKQAIICSELVFRCYDEAIVGYDDPYTIHLERDQALRGMQLNSNNLLRLSSLSNESLISHFYGSDRRSFNFNLNF